MDVHIQQQEMVVFELCGIIPSLVVSRGRLYRFVLHMSIFMLLVHNILCPLYYVHYVRRCFYNILRPVCILFPKATRQKVT